MSDRLRDYRAKRDFAATPEPADTAPGPAGDADGPRFVVQRHSARALHFDLRLEIDGTLASWAVPKGIPLRTGAKRLAVRTEDHPLTYLDFHGIIPEGQYGAGRMTVWDTGRYTPILLDEREIKVHLTGRVLDGEYHLVRTGERGGREEWLVFRSARGDEGPPDPRAAFRALRPMLAQPVDAPFDDDGWAFEIKWDGHRCLALVDSEGTELRSRGGHNVTADHPALADLRRSIDAQEAVLDGELVVLDERGRAVFQDLQAGRGTVTYVVFDLLYVDGEWIDGLPWDERRERLRQVLGDPVVAPLLLSDDVAAEGRALFAAVAAQDGEGVVAKRRTSRYAAGGRSPDWRKVKVRHETEAGVCGFMPGEGSRRGTFGALILCEDEGDGPRYVGRVGSGFTEAATRDLRARLDRLVITDAPLDPVPAELRGATWVRAGLTCRVAYADRTEEGILRHPVFQGLVEPDRGPVARVLDTSAGELRLRDGDREVRLTNLAKPFWPSLGITKGDLLDHYARMAPVLVPHIAGRPMVMKRYPDGWDHQFFFQHALPDTAPPWLGRARLEKGDDAITYGVVDDPMGLLWMVNLGCIDLNPWHARAATPHLAEHVLFDLDPQEGVPFDTVREVALAVRDELAAIGLRCHAKTSGSRGMHVIVPIIPAPHESTRLFANLIARRLVTASPATVTVETAIARRGRRVYVDANQNGYGKTIASVYSVRAVATATVSTPVTWDEVAEGVDPTRLTMEAVAERVGTMGDLFADVLAGDQDLAAAVERLGER